MDGATKKQIGLRLREKRTQAGYTRQQLGKMCSLSPRFIANVEFGESTFSIDSIISVCNALRCSSDYILFGDTLDKDAWADTIEVIKHFDIAYKEAIDKILYGVADVVWEAKKQREIALSREPKEA